MLKQNFLLLCCLFVLVNHSVAETRAKIKIGLSTALTGSSSTTGQDIRDTVLFANDILGKDRYEIIIEDDKCSGKDAVTVANKFINIDKVDYVIGLACSGAALAALPIYNRAEVPTIVTTASSAKIADAGEYVFRVFPSDKNLANVLQKYLANKYKKISILSEETEYAQDLQSSFFEANTEGSLQIKKYSYIPNTNDFRTLLTKIRSDKHEAIFLNVQSEDTFAVLLKQIREQGWNIPIYGAYYPASKAFLSVAGDLAVGIEFVDVPSLTSILNKEGLDLFSQFTAQGYSIRSIETVFATTFEAFRLLDQFAQNKDVTIQNVSSKKFEGVFGAYSFDEKGEVQGITYQMKKISSNLNIELIE